MNKAKQSMQVEQDGPRDERRARIYSAALLSEVWPPAIVLPAGEMRRVHGVMSEPRGRKRRNAPRPH